MRDCIFCRIISGEIPCTKIYENDGALAFFDIDPKAPTHAVIIPKTHIADVTQLTDSAMMSAIFDAVAEVARRTKVEKTGFRLVANTGADAGQSVPHLHFHLLGGKAMGWPPYSNE